MTGSALLTALPALKIPWAPLGRWPTPLEPAPGIDGLLLKREDASHTIYGGNKVRTLEMLLGQAKAAGHQRIWSIGAFGAPIWSIGASRTLLRPLAVRSAPSFSSSSSSSSS